MKCLKCGAPTEVMATRAYMDVFLRRTRECFNGHRTSTYEVSAAALDRRQLPAIQRGVQARGLAQKRKLAVLRAPDKTAAELASQLGITEARVRQIRKDAR